MFNYSLCLADLLSTKSVREWREYAHERGMKMSECMNAAILDKILWDYNHGIITANECDEIRKEWNV